MMITVNLRPGQKRKAPGGGTRQVLDRFKTLGAKVKDPFLVGAAAACIGTAVFLGYGFVTSNAQYNALAPKLEAARDEQKRFDNLLKQKRRAELIGDSLKAQIATIRGVDGDRYIWPHVLDEVAKALPPYTWLTTIGQPVAQRAVVTDTGEVAPRAMVFKLEGRTMDLQAYTRFLRQLEASPWLDNVTPLEAKTIVERERPVTQFTIQASFAKADSAYIRTVPISQSVR
jgi:Tfp pilus assembly protein PilN